MRANITTAVEMRTLENEDADGVYTCTSTQDSSALDEGGEGHVPAALPAVRGRGTNDRSDGYGEEIISYPHRGSNCRPYSLRRVATPTKPSRSLYSGKFVPVFRKNILPCFSGWTCRWKSCISPKSL
jgi:hypothetical protein